MESKTVSVKYLEFTRLGNRKLKRFYGKEHIIKSKMKWNKLGIAVIHLYPGH